MWKKKVWKSILDIPPFIFLVIVLLWVLIFSFVLSPIIDKSVSSAGLRFVILFLLYATFPVSGSLLHRFSTRWRKF